MTSNDLVIRFLESIGRPDEAQFYLSLFKSERPEQFAIVAIADSVMQETSDVLVTDLRFLSQLGLTPVVMLGVVTPTLATQHANRICERLTPQVSCTIVDPYDTAQVRRAAHNGNIAIAPFPDDGKSIDDRFDVLARLATGLSSRKLMFLGARSGLQTQLGKVLSLVNMTTEYTELIQPNRLLKHQQAFLQQIHRLFRCIDRHTTIAVTSPLDLLRELFTSNGAGTLIHRGSSISRFNNVDAVDITKLRHLIEAAFQRSLTEDFFTRPMSALYVADDYRGAAVTIETPTGHYLTKFAVDQQARGEGVGRDLWQTLHTDCPRLFWRSRTENPLTQWYQQRCDGLVRDDSWHVFWRGLSTDEIPEAINYAQTAPLDFLTSAP